MRQKIKCAVIGPGNIGTDLLYKLMRSALLEPVWMVGVDPTSEGLQRARELGLKTTDQGVDGLLPHVLADGVQISFDATSAYVHAENSRKLTALGVLTIDLTPAAIGPFCVPPVNLLALPDQGATNVNMVTCGGQATLPMIAATAQVQAVDYGEIVATISSKSAGPGTPAEDGHGRFFDDGAQGRCCTLGQRGAPDGKLRRQLHLHHRLGRLHVAR